MKFNGILSVLASLGAIVHATSTFSPARPPAVPLAVRSPYLSTWMQAGKDGGNGGYLTGEWPAHWAGKSVGWTGMIRVDNETYLWMGDPVHPPKAVTQTSFQYTSTKSIFTMNVDGKVTMTITFLSPVTPADMKRQSLTMSYMDVSVQSKDGKAHDVQLYSDISAEWVSGNNNAMAEWEFGTTGNIAYHKVWAQDQLAFSETKDMADWGYWYYAMESGNGMTWQSGEDTVVRGEFMKSGVLANSNDTNFRAISNKWPVFGFTQNLGSVNGKVDTLFTIGLSQEQAVQFTGASGTAPVNSLWTSYFDSDVAALSWFYQDYQSNALSMSTNLDNQIASDSTANGGADFATVTTLAVRQAFGGVQLCGTQDKMYMFLKEISSDGNVNTVDVIFPAHPIFVYTNPTLLKLLLDPLFENQEAGHYPNKYSMHDLGTNYPNATGHPQGNDEYMPLEECGNMLIMTLLYAQAAKDTAYLTQHYQILDQWTNYLIQEALYPGNQLSTDDFLGPLTNMTNLALKGMIGIGAMSQIANLTGNTADAQNYSTISTEYMTKFQTLAINKSAKTPFLQLTYGDTRYGLMYNLYGDKALGLDLVPQSVYDIQSNFLPTVKQKYGVPLDPRHSWTKSDWEMFSASVASNETAELLISDLAAWVGSTPTNRAMTDLYDAKSSNWPSGGPEFEARPVMGGMFAPLVTKGLVARSGVTKN